MKKIIFILFLIGLFSCNKNEFVYEPQDYGTLRDTFLDDWTYSILPPLNLSYSKAEFRLWIPDDASNLKAILVLTPGYNGNGTGLADDETWQQFAQEENTALIGITFKDNENVSGYYYDAFEGTGIALLNAVQKICERNEIPETAELPFLLCGHSAGGCFSYSFSLYKPERVAGYINMKGGCTLILNQTEIPGLLVSGEFDYPEILYSKAMSIRRNNGLVCYAVEPGGYHEWGKPEFIMQPFLKAVLEKRFDANDSTNHNLIPLSLESGLLGNLENFNYYPYNDYPGDQQSASWLISEEFAETWSGYVSN